MKTESEESFERSLYYHLSRTKARVNWIYLLLAGALLVSALMLPFLKVQVGVSTTGMIRSPEPTHLLRAPASGTILHTRIQENQPVSRGDTLGILRSTLLQGQLEHAEREARKIRDRLADLDLLLDLSDLHEDPALPYPEPGLRDPMVRSSYLEWLDEIRQLIDRIDRLKRSWDRTRKLGEEAFVSQEELERTEFELQQARHRLNLALSSRLLRWQELRDESEQQRTRVFEEIQNLREELGRTVIRSPENGTLQDVISLLPGNRIQEQQVLAKISPSGSLIAELHIPSDKIGWVREGMPVRLQIDAFDYREWGLISGTVQSIPKDITMEPIPHYRVRARLQTRSLELENGFRGNLRKGMTLKARLLLTERSMFQLLFDRAAEWLDPRWSKSVIRTVSTHPEMEILQ